MNKNNMLFTNASLYEEFKGDFTYHSSSIEGSQLKKEDNSKLINSPYDKKLISQELLNYRHDEVFENRNLGIVFDMMLTSINEPLSRQILCNWHKLLKQDTYWSKTYPDAVGKYRKINVDVGDSLNFSLSFQLIKESMLNFLNDINYNRKMSIDDICEFHCRFEKIHPFLDGNGRIGRLIMLRQCILNNIGLFIISSETRQEYINSLKLYHQTGISSFLTAYCKKLQIFFKEKYESKYQIDLIDREVWVVNFIKQNGYIKRTDIEKHFKIKITSANNLINNLIKSKVIVPKNKGRLTVYVLNA